MSRVLDLRRTWSESHPVRLRFVHNGDVVGFIALPDAVARLAGYEARGAVPLPADYPDRLAAGEVITTHITEYELLPADPGDDA